MTHDGTTPAGWYPDPDGPGSLRYWDGERWTDHRHAAEGPPSGPTDRGDVAKGGPNRWLLVGLGLLVVAALVVGALVLVGGDDGDDDTAATSSFARLLATVPDDPAYTGYLLLTDYARAAEAVGERVPTGTNEDDVVEYVLAVTGPFSEDELRALAPAAAFAQAEAFEAQGWRDEFGFSIVDTVAAMDAGAPPEQLWVYEIDVTDQDVDDAVRSDPVWSDRLTDDEHAGTSYYQWGADPEIDIERRTAARPLGRGGQLALIDGVAVRTVDDDVMHDALDAVADGATVADDPDAMAVVRALDERAVFSLLLTDTALTATPDAVLPEDASPAQLEALEEALADTPTLAPYEWLGAGMALDGQDFLNVIVLNHADEDAAIANVDRLTQVVEQGRSFTTQAPWSDSYRLRSVDAQGTLTIAVLEVVPERTPLVWLRSFIVHDSLYWAAG